MLQKDNMYSVLTSNSVACLLLHLTCAMNYSTLPWWTCGIESGPWVGGVEVVALQKEKQMCCRTCAKQCLKADSSCPGPVCNSLSLERLLTSQTDISVIPGSWHPWWDSYKGDRFSKWSWLKSYKGWIQAYCRKVSLQYDSGKQDLIWWFLAVTYIPNLASTAGCFRGCYW